MRKRAFQIRKEHAAELLEEAKSLATYIAVDHLPPGVMTRRGTDKSIPWVTNHILNSKRVHFAFIEREQFANEPPYFDVGCSTLASDPEYFLWIRVPISAGEMLIEKYQLKQMQ